MSRYQNEAEAAADGFTIVHEPESARYAVYAEGGRLVGEAHYSLLGDSEIDFDHTVVAPELRGSGISGLLAHRAVTGDAVGARKIRASCWFIAGYLERHPELVSDAG